MRLYNKGGKNVVTMNVSCWEWLFGGNAIFHVHNAKGQEFVYKIVRAELDCNCEGNPHCANCGGTGKSHRHFALLVRNNYPALEGKSGYIGEVTPNAPCIRTTSKSRWAEDSLPFRILLWALRIVHSRKKWPKGYGLTTRRCGYCGEQIREEHTAEYSYCVGSCKPKEERRINKKKEPASTCMSPDLKKIAEGINLFCNDNYTAEVDGNCLVVKNRQGKEVYRASSVTSTLANAPSNARCATARAR